MLKFEMCEDCVLVLPINDEDSLSDGGIVVPGQAKDRPIVGIVKAVGPGVKMDDGTRFPETIVAGDKILFPKKSGDKVYIDGQDFIIIPARYVLAVIVEDECEPVMRDSSNL